MSDSRNAAGRLGEDRETYTSDPAGSFSRVIDLGKLTVTKNGKYRVVDDRSLEMARDGAAEKSVWRMTFPRDKLTLAYPKHPDPGPVGAGASRLTRQR